MATIAGGVSMKRRDLIRQKNKLAKTGGFRYIRYAKYACVAMVVLFLVYVGGLSNLSGKSYEDLISKSPIVITGFMICTANLYVWVCTEAFSEGSCGSSACGKHTCKSAADDDWTIHSDELHLGSPDDAITEKIFPVEYLFCKECTEGNKKRRTAVCTDCNSTCTDTLHLSRVWYLFLYSLAVQRFLVMWEPLFFNL